MRPDRPTPTRALALEAVRATPGITVQAIAEKLGIDHSTAEYHLHRLIRAGDVRAVRAGRVRAHYAAGAPLCPFLRKLAPCFPKQDQREALAAFARGDARCASDIVPRSGIPIQQARWVQEKAAREGILVPRAFADWRVPDPVVPCLLHLAAGTACHQWGRCPVSRGPPFNGGANEAPPLPRPPLRQAS